MTTVDSTGENRQTRRPEVDLDRRYGRIAISALVAALPYGGESKTRLRNGTGSQDPGRWRRKPAHGSRRLSRSIAPVRRCHLGLARTYGAWP